MLTNLSISNFALIEKLDLAVGDGFNTITGETGAGKSILLGALGLLLGNRSDSKALGDKSKKCIIEAEFDISNLNLKPFFQEHELDWDDHTLIRRELLSSGKTRAFINDTPVRLDILKEVGVSLIDIHSQHQTLLLKNSNFQLNILDAFVGNLEILKDYRIQYKEYLNLSKEIKNLEETREKDLKEYDYNAFLLEELLAVNIQPEELEVIEEKLKLAENSKEIKNALAEGYSVLEGDESSVGTQLNLISSRLDTYTKLLEGVEVIAGRLESTCVELQDLAQEMLNVSESIETDEESLVYLQNRNDILINLSQKHHVNSTEALLSIQEELEEKNSKTEEGGEELEKLYDAQKRLYVKLDALSKSLHKNRLEKKEGFEQEVVKNLAHLGMGDAKLIISVEETELNLSGKNKIEFLFSANKGRTPELLGKVASGGEFSRLMFVLKYLQTDSSELPTVIFDEIDTGISGEIALKMAEMMSKMSEDHQIITITHLPQVAGYGKNHYYVFKDRSGAVTSSQIRQLEDKERVLKIAEMISGTNPTESALKSARELIHS